MAGPRVTLTFELTTVHARLDNCHTSGLTPRAKSALLLDFSRTLRQSIPHSKLSLINTTSEIQKYDLENGWRSGD